jgi:hypothetical protein
MAGVHTPRRIILFDAAGPYILSGMSIEKRAHERKKRIVAHISRSFEEAEQWDLEYWQSLPPASRLSALVAIRRDIAKVGKSKK